MKQSKRLDLHDSNHEDRLIVKKQKLNKRTIRKNKRIVVNPVIATASPAHDDNDDREDDQTPTTSSPQSSQSQSSSLSVGAKSSSCSSSSFTQQSALGKQHGRGADEDYKLKKFITKGSFGQVFATGEGDEIVKISTEIERAVIEIGNMRALSHPNIISMLDFRSMISENGEYSLAIRMPRIRSRLDTQIKKVKSLEVKLDLCKQILEALRYLHDDRQMIHRDIKPDNILVELSPKPGSRPRVLLCDFGNATWSVPGRNYTAPISIYSYSAPETILTSYRTGKGKAKYTTAIDIFAFGCILWELLSEGQQGRYLGDITDEPTALHVHTIWAVRSDDFQKDLRCSAPTPELGDLLVGALHNQPELRFSASKCILHIGNAIPTCAK